MTQCEDETGTSILYNGLRPLGSPNRREHTAAVSSEKSGVGEPLTVDEVRRLLIGYGVALDAADSLPALVRVASRPRRWRAFDRFRCLPRPTVGTSSMVTYHVRRSTAALVRRYARMAATRGLTDEEAQASKLVKTFHASLSDLRWKLIVPGGLIAVFIAIQIILPRVIKFVTGVVQGARHGQGGPNAEQVHALAESVIAGWAEPTAGSFIDVFAQFDKAGPTEWLTFAAAILAAAYLVVRPLSPAFRIKRIIFNLAPTGHVDLGHTTTTWNVARSLGLYQLERTTFARLGARAPREIDFDLWISAVPAAVLARLLWTGNTSLLSNTPAVFGGILVFCAGLVGARIAWLVQTGKARRRVVSPADPPAGFRMSAADGVVEARSVVETAALGLAWFWCLGYVLPSLVWVRLVRERRDLERARHHVVGASTRLPSPQVWSALGSAMLLSLVPPVPLAIHLTRLARLQPLGVGSARRTRAWLVPLAAAATVLEISSIVTHFGGSWSSGVSASFIPAGAMFAVAFAAVQHEHNALVQRVGVPLPFDEPELAAVGVLPRRVLAAIVDAIPILVFGTVGFGVAVATSESCVVDEYGNCYPVFTDTGRAAVLFAALLALAYAIWNWGCRQGTIGSSVGKSVWKFEVVGEKTRQPMTKRNWIYVALLVFITFGMLVDAIVWPNGSRTLTWNDLIQAIGIVILVSWWQIVDANQLGQRRSTAAKIFAILVPVGHAIYLYQSRNWKPATALFLLYWAGILIVYIAASFAAGMLVAPGWLVAAE
jgi:hypothetical protein